jgi:hypothetical protein
VSEPVPGTGSWWLAGDWIGPGDLGKAVCATLGDVAGSWNIGPQVATAAGSIVLHAGALDDHADIDGLEAVYERCLAGAEPPARIISLVWDSWLGRGSTGRATAASAAAVGLARNWALRLAPASTSVNIVALPDGFPDAVPAPTVPVQTPAGIEDLGHVVRYFGHPDNGYVIGQLISLGGGDFVWSNHSL